MELEQAASRFKTLFDWMGTDNRSTVGFLISSIQDDVSGLFVLNRVIRKSDNLFDVSFYAHAARPSTGPDLGCHERQIKNVAWFFVLFCMCDSLFSSASGFILRFLNRLCKRDVSLVWLADSYGHNF